MAKNGPLEAESVCCIYGYATWACQHNMDTWGISACQPTGAGYPGTCPFVKVVSEAPEVEKEEVAA
jgi:hypothetical protein